MNRFSNFLRSYTPHGRHAMLISLGDMFLCILAITNCIPNLSNINNIDLRLNTFDFSGPDYSSDKERREVIYGGHIGVAIVAAISMLFATFLGIGIIKRSPRWINSWIVANMTFISLAFVFAVISAWCTPLVVLLKMVIPLGSAVIYRSLQCWSVKEFHWEISSTRTLLKEENNICINCENNASSV